MTLSPDATTLAILTRERDAAIRQADRYRDLCEKATSALKGADAEIARLRARASLPRWWCTACDYFCIGGDACGRCRKAKTVQS